MKKIIVTLIVLCWLQHVSAQVPNMFNYQAVARNAFGQGIPNANIRIRITLFDGGATGTSVYSETRQAATNQLGLFTLSIGGAGAISSTGNFATINWSTGNKFIKVEVDPLGGNNFITLGNTELLSVPYALYAVNGKQGPVGPQGVPGPQGTQGIAGLKSLVKTTAEPAGANCANGGQKVESGVDANNNNVLDAAEITATGYTCNGNNGTVLNAWNITGNTSTNPATHFIGTADNQPLRFKVNNSWAGEIHPSNANLFFGLNAGSANTTGQSNTGIGKAALSLTTSGAYNTAVGYNALSNNTTGNGNTANGVSALSLNTTGGYNTSVGQSALSSNTTGADNTAIGVNALGHNITGKGNTATGLFALSTNTTGYGNTAIGTYALEFNTNGDGNVATGMKALNQNNGFYNTANGYDALLYNSTGSSNTATGAEALKYNSTGFENTATGNLALYSNTLGAENVAVGSVALGLNTTGSYNVAIGERALSTNDGGLENIAIGNHSGTALGSPNASNTISIGNDGYLNGASNQVFIGNLSTVYNGGNKPWSTFSDERIKRNITEEVIGLDFITRLRPVTYYRSIKAVGTVTGDKETPDYPEKYDIEKIKETGFLAQEVEAAAKATGFDFSGVGVPKKSNQLYTLSYELFVVPLVKAVQEQQTLIQKQQSQIALLEKRLLALEAKK
jgi:trimeric autotransporter adhesin